MISKTLCSSSEIFQSNRANARKRKRKTLQLNDRSNFTLWSIYLRVHSPRGFSQLELLAGCLSAKQQFGCQQVIQTHTRQSNFWIGLSGGDDDDDDDADVWARLLHFMSQLFSLSRACCIEFR